MAKYCTHCGIELNDDRTVCPYCGSKAKDYYEPDDNADYPDEHRSKAASAQNENGATFFDGSVLGWIGHALGTFLLCIIPLIGQPFAFCFMGRWLASHTVIKGKRHKFVGSSATLLGNWIIWCLLSVITFGIYGLWVPTKVLKWIVNNVTYDD